jgi:hypothetical protein
MVMYTVKFPSLGFVFLPKKSSAVHQCYDAWIVLPGECLVNVDCTRCRTVLVKELSVCHKMTSVAFAKRKK